MAKRQAHRIGDVFGVWIWSPPEEFTVEDHAENRDTEATYKRWGDGDPENGVAAAGDDRFGYGSKSKCERIFSAACRVLRAAHFDKVGTDTDITNGGFVVRRISVHRNAKTGLQRWVVLQAIDFSRGDCISRARGN